MLTDEDLRGSLYYPAAGTDLTPVLLLGDRIGTFVYTDWNLEHGKVAAKFAKAAEESGNKLSLTDSQIVDLNSYPAAKLATNYVNTRSRISRLRERTGNGTGIDSGELFPDGFSLSLSELSEYGYQSSKMTGTERPWITEFTFEHLGSTGSRQLRLVYFSDEGLARFCRLYSQHKLAPQVLCTIQSGPGFGYGWAKLEQPGGVFERLLLCCPKGPAIWIRGEIEGPPVGDSHWCELASDYPSWSDDSVVAAAYRPTQQQGMIDA